MRIGDIMIIFVRWRWSKQRRRRLHTVAVSSGGSDAGVHFYERRACRDIFPTCTDLVRSDPQARSGHHGGEAEGVCG